MGRPRKNPRDLHDCPVKIYLSESQKETLLAACNALGKDQSTLVRDLFFETLNERYADILDQCAN